jgi:hypothetical protein
MDQCVNRTRSLSVVRALVVLVVFPWGVAIARPQQAMTTVDDSDPSIVYSQGQNGNGVNGWNTGSDPNDFGGGEHYTNAFSGSFVVHFSGTDFQWIGKKGPNFGIANVFMDGQLVATVDSYDPNVLYQQVLYSTSGLSNDVHVFQMMIGDYPTPARNPASSDCYQVMDGYATSGTPLSSPMISPQDNSVTKIGTWTFGPNILSGAYCWSNDRATPASLTFPFSGTAVEVYGHPEGEDGMMDVYIDGSYVTTVDEFNPLYDSILSDAKDDTMLYCATGLPNGNHTIQLVVAQTHNPNSLDYFTQIDGFIGLAPVSGPPPPPPPPPGVVITNQNSGMALDVQGAGTDPGTIVWQYTPNGGVAQNWQITPVGDGNYYVTNPNSGMDLNVAGASMDPGAQLIIWPRTPGALNAEWQITSNPNGTFTLTSAQSGLVLDVQGGSTDSGTPVVQMPANGSASQEWNIPGFALPPPPPPVFVLTNQNSGMALDVQGAGTDPGTIVWQYTPNGGVAQNWQITPVGDGNYYVTNPNSAMDLNVAGASMDPGAQLIIWPRTPGALNAEWQITSNPNGTFTLTSAQSGLVLDVQGGSTDSGTPVVQMPANGSASQEWNIPGFALPPTDPPASAAAAVSGSTGGTGGAGGACGLTGLETVLVLGLLALRRRKA